MFDFAVDVFIQTTGAGTANLAAHLIQQNGVSAIVQQDGSLILLNDGSQSLIPSLDMTNSNNSQYIPIIF